MILNGVQQTSTTVPMLMCFGYVAVFGHHPFASRFIFRIQRLIMHTPRINPITVVLEVFPHKDSMLTDSNMPQPVVPILVPRIVFVKSSRLLMYLFPDHTDHRTQISFEHATRFKIFAPQPVCCPKDHDAAIRPRGSGK